MRANRDIPGEAVYENRQLEAAYVVRPGRGGRCDKDADGHGRRQESGYQVPIVLARPPRLVWVVVVQPIVWVEVTGGQ